MRYVHGWKLLQVRIEIRQQDNDYLKDQDIFIHSLLSHGAAIQS